MKRSTTTAIKRQTDAQMLRQKLVAIAEAQSVGSREPARHTHIGCRCGNNDHLDLSDQGCFCPPCAVYEAARRGFDANDVEPENEGPDDSPQWCEDCNVLITLRNAPDLDWGISQDGAEEELEHYEPGGLGFDRGEPSTPDHWRVLLLVIDSIADEHLVRVEAVVSKALARGNVSSLQS